jgi:hypothetical protein
MSTLDLLFRIPAMQLIQIGEVRQKTVLDLVQEMAARQFAEIEQLKRATLNAARPGRQVRRRRCSSSKRPA